MEINVSVQCNGGLLPDIILSTRCTGCGHHLRNWQLRNSASNFLKNKKLTIRTGAQFRGGNKNKNTPLRCKLRLRIRTEHTVVVQGGGVQHSTNSVPPTFQIWCDIPLPSAATVNSSTVRQYSTVVQQQYCCTYNPQQQTRVVALARRSVLSLGDVSTP